MGQYTALCAAGALDFETTLRLVALRADLMQSAVPMGVGAMGVVIGLEAKVLEKLCQEIALESKQCIACANYNAPEQVVVSGEKRSVLTLMTLAKKSGARLVKRLAVSVPSHCNLMKSASQALSEQLLQLTFSELNFPIVDNVDACYVTDLTQIKTNLAQQLYLPVRWQRSIEVLSKDRLGFIELGPRKILSGLNKRISPDLNIISISDVQNLKAFQSDQALKR